MNGREQFLTVMAHRQPDRIFIMIETVKQYRKYSLHLPEVE
ncbi:hypothetical protein [Lactonifactor longoviformis]